MGELFIPPSAGGPDEITPTHPNKYSLAWGEWRKHVVKEASYVKSVESFPAVGYILNGPTPPNGDRITDFEVFPIKNGYGIMPYPGTWWIRWVQPATAAGVENYVLKPGVSPDVIRILLALEAFPEGFDLVKWGGTLVSAAQAATSDANFDDDLVGPAVNARIARARASTFAWVRATAETITSVHGRSHSADYWDQVVSVILGRDVADNTVRAIGAGVGIGGVSQANALYRLLVSAEMGVQDISGAEVRALHGDVVSNTIAGRLAATARGLWANAVLQRYDPINATLHPSSQARTATGTAVAPAANVVLATLDAQDLANKSIMITDTAVGGYNILGSIDGVTYRTIVAAAATAIGTVVPTAAQLDAVKGLRFVRITSSGSAGTQIAEISAMGS